MNAQPAAQTPEIQLAYARQALYHCQRMAQNGQTDALTLIDFWQRRIAAIYDALECEEAA